MIDKKLAIEFFKIKVTVLVVMMVTDDMLDHAYPLLITFYSLWWSINPTTVYQVNMA